MSRLAEAPSAADAYAASARERVRLSDLQECALRLVLQHDDQTSLSLRQLAADRLGRPAIAPSTWHDSLRGLRELGLVAQAPAWDAAAALAEVAADAPAPPATVQLTRAGRILACALEIAATSTDRAAARKLAMRIGRELIAH